MALREQRMVAADREALRQSLQQPARQGMHDRGLAVHRHVQQAERAAEIFDNALQSEAHAEDRDALFDQQIKGFANREIGGPARPRRQHDEVGTQPLAQLLAGKVVTQGRHRRAGRAYIAGQRVHEAILVIDQQHLASTAGARLRGCCGPRRGLAGTADRAE